jgi:hypothetical protein
MATEQTTPDLLSGHAASPVRSRSDGAPGTYGRLLAEYVALVETLEFNPYMPIGRQFLLFLNPLAVRRLRKMPMTRDFQRVPDAVRQELPHADKVLHSIHELDDAQLLALARCSRLNVDKLNNRLFFGGWNKAFVTTATVVAAAKGLKGLFDINLDVPFIKKEALLAVLSGFAIPAIIGYFVLYHRVRLVRALDDIISIAVAARNLKKRDPEG